MSNYENYENYVIWSDQVWNADEWESSGMSEKYDDVIRCRVNLDHPNYNEESFEAEMISWWGCGPQPTYASKL